MDEHQKIVRAKQRVEALTGFYIHAAIFVLVMALLFIVNATSSGAWWVQWVLLGWGAGVLAHAWFVFGQDGGPNFITAWQLRKIKELKDRM